MVENLTAHIASLETRVAELERRPVAIVRAEEPGKPAHRDHAGLKRFVLAEEFAWGSNGECWRRSRG